MYEVLLRFLLQLSKFLLEATVGCKGLTIQNIFCLPDILQSSSWLGKFDSNWYGIVEDIREECPFVHQFWLYWYIYPKWGFKKNWFWIPNSGQRRTYPSRPVYTRKDSLHFHELTVSFQRVNEFFCRHLAIVNSKVRCSFTCNEFSYDVMMRDELVYHRFRMYTAVRVFHFFQTYVHTLLYVCSPYRGFFAEGTKNCVHWSELRGVHYVEVCLQRKSIGGPKMYSNRGCSLIELLLFFFCWFVVVKLRSTYIMGEWKGKQTKEKKSRKRIKQT